MLLDASDQSRRLSLLLLLMAVIAFLVGGILVLMLFMAIFAVAVVGGLEFLDIAFRFLGIMTGTAFFDRLTLFPHVFATVIFMMAISAHGSIVRGMFLVG